jgi:hypothetical protein
MPRPKPPEELKPRCIRLSDTEWAVFRIVGGADWLRSRLGKLNKVNNLKAIRNRRIRMDVLGGMTLDAVAKKYALDRSTVWRIVK